MISSDLLSIIRADILRDSAVPYLWSDSLLYRYLSDAQEIHARRAYSIVDDSKTVSTAAGTQTYALPTGTIHVLSGRVSTDAQDLRDYTRKVIPYQLTTDQNKPQIYTLDEATGKIRFYPTPDAVYTINLRVARLPTNDISVSVNPEIDSRYHMDLTDYVAWRCLQNNDTDGQSIKAADRHHADWDQRLSDAKREYYRLQLGAHPSVVSSWTGKRNG